MLPLWVTNETTIVPTYDFGFPWSQQSKRAPHLQHKGLWSGYRTCNYVGILHFTNLYCRGAILNHDPIGKLKVARILIRLGLNLD